MLREGRGGPLTFFVMQRPAKGCPGGVSGQWYFGPVSPDAKTLPSKAQATVEGPTTFDLKTKPPYDLVWRVRVSRVSRGGVAQMVRATDS